MTFETLKAETDDQRSVIDMCTLYAREFKEKPHHSLVLLGGTGAGKTRLLHHTAESIIRAHRESVLFCMASELTNYFKDNYTTRKLTDEAVMNRFVAPALLMIDELGLGWGTDADKHLLTRVFVRRHQDRKGTILAGNLLREEMRAVVGDRVADRLNENTTVLTLKWPSWRGRRG